MNSSSCSSSSSDGNGSINGDLDKIDSREPGDVLKILVTTDNHLGFMEKVTTEILTSNLVVKSVKNLILVLKPTLI